MRLTLLDLQRDYLEQETIEKRGPKFAKLMGAMRVICDHSPKEDPPLSELEVLELLGPPDYGLSDKRGATFIYVCGNSAYSVNVGPDGLVNRVGSGQLRDAHLSDAPRWRPYYQRSALPSGTSYLGIEVAVDGEHAGGPNGLRVVGTVPDSPASKSMLKSGDLIVAINGKAIGRNDADVFRQITASMPAGTIAAIQFIRPEQDGTYSAHDVKLTVGTWSAPPDDAGKVMEKTRNN